eukprot:symbB.v1.2.000736.t1/scaffold36.1/size400579/8
MLVSVDVVKQLQERQQLHELPGELMRRSMQMGQRLSILAYDVATSREEVRIVLQGVSPTLASVICSSTVLEAFCVVANEVRRCLGFEDEEVDTRNDQLRTAVGWLQRPQLSIGFEDDQLRCYGLAQQATRGDAPAASGQGALTALGSWEECRGMPKAEASEKLLKELAEKDPTFRKVVPAAAPETQEEPLNDFVQVICELFEFRLPMDLDDRVAKLKRRAFWVSLLSVIAWRRYVRSKPTTIPKVMTTASLSTLSAYLGVLHLGLPAFIYARLPARIRAARVRLPGAAGRLLRWILQLLLPPLNRPLMITAGVIEYNGYSDLEHTVKIYRQQFVDAHLEAHLEAHEVCINDYVAKYYAFRRLCLEHPPGPSLPTAEFWTQSIRTEAGLPLSPTTDSSPRCRHDSGFYAGWLAKCSQCANNALQALFPREGQRLSMVIPYAEHWEIDLRNFMAGRRAEDYRIEDRIGHVTSVADLEHLRADQFPLQVYRLEDAPSPNLCLIWCDWLHRQSSRVTFCSMLFFVLMALGALWARQMLLIVPAHKFVSISDVEA